MTGEAFCDADSSSIFDILQRNFLLAYGTYAFPSMILQIMSIVLAMVAAAGSFAVTYGMFEIQEEVMATNSTYASRTPLNHRFRRLVFFELLYHDSRQHHRRRFRLLRQR